MDVDPTQLRNMMAVRTFWQEFFNEAKMAAFDEVAALPNYHHNGKNKDGTNLKKWIQGLQAEYQLNVEVAHTIPDKNRVALYWVARPVRKKDGAKMPSIHGINVLSFNPEGRIEQNWNCINGIL